MLHFTTTPLMPIMLTEQFGSSISASDLAFGSCRTLALLGDFFPQFSSVSPGKCWDMTSN